MTVRLRSVLLSVCFSFCLLLFAGCGNQELSSDNSNQLSSANSTTQNEKVYRVYGESLQGNVTYFDKQNTIISQENFLESVKLLPQDSNYAISIQVLDEDPSSNIKARMPPLGCIWIDVRWEKHYVGGCINRNAWHINFHIRDKCTKNSPDLFNMHVVVWWENGPQMGLYNSANGWCAQSRGTFTEIRQLFINAFATVGVTGTTAYVLAQLAASITSTAFAL
jgi:hypothetical protein